MNDRDFLMWLHELLTEQHGENTTCDYMHKLRAIIRSTPADKFTPNVTYWDSLEELRKDLENFGDGETRR